MNNFPVENLNRSIPNFKLILILTIIINYLSLSNASNDKNTTSLIIEKNKTYSNTTSKYSNTTKKMDNIVANYTMPQSIQIIPVKLNYLKILKRKFIQNCY